MSLGHPIKSRRWGFPEKTNLTGRYVRLEPLADSHLGDLWTVARNAPDSFTYLRYGPFETRAQLASVIADLRARDDQPFWAVVGADGCAQGWLSICDVSQADGAFEIGSIWFAPVLQGTREAREAIFLLMCLGMDGLQYERLAWRCQAQNERSFKAALGLGFTHEGTWRNAMIYENWQRDIAWFSIIRQDWPRCKTALELWLLPQNFDAEGKQVRHLHDIRDNLQQPERP